MSVSTPALLVAAGGVGFGHAVLPDHWVPLAVVSRTRRYPLGRVARLALLAGIAHVLVSVALGSVIALIGLQFRSSVTQFQDTLVGLTLIITGVAFAAMELTGHGHSHDHTHDHGDSHSPEREHGQDHSDAHQRQDHARAEPSRGLIATMIPFGAAASPDLTILPVFLAAAAIGPGAAAGSLVLFSAATITTFVGLTTLAAATGRLIGAHWLEEWGNAITAAVLVVIGLLVLTGTI